MRPLHLAVPVRSQFRHLDCCVHRPKSSLPVDRCHVGVIPATSPLRTIIDLAAVASIEQVEEALDGAERDGKVNRRALEERLSQLRASGRNGVGAIAAMLERRTAVRQLPTSVLERRFRRILERRGLPQPVAQHEVTRTDGGTAYPRLRVRRTPRRGRAARQRRPRDAAATRRRLPACERTAGVAFHGVHL
jgi:hypothetical protein